MSFHEDIKNHFVAIESVDRFNHLKIKTNKNKIVKKISSRSLGQ